MRWYATLALWKAAIFLEGSYKRLLAGTTDDPFFQLLDTGVPDLAEHALAGGAWRVSARRTRSALLVDWGGVLTTNLFASFGAFCTDAGLAPEALAQRVPRRRAFRELLIGFEEGRVEEPAFEEGFGGMLGIAHAA